MSLYADYLAELGFRHIIENDDGFIVYSINGIECFIEELYVVPDKRLSHAGTSLEQQAMAMGKASGCKFMSCTVTIPCKQSTESLKAILKSGYRLCRADATKIYLIKEIN